MEPEKRGLPAIDSLGVSRRVAGLSLAWEQAWPRLVPFLLVVCAFVTVSWFGLWPLTADWLRWAALAVFAAAAVVSLVPLFGFRLPSAGEVDARLERRNRLEHRPISAQTDPLAAGRSSPFSQALWHEHRHRMAATISNLRAGAPNPEVARFDPLGLRAIAPLLLFVAFGFGVGHHIERLGDAFRSHAAAGETAARIDVWVTPPAYTNKPPLFLKAVAKGADAPAYDVPEGSEFVLRISGPAVPRDIELAFEGASGVRTIEPVEPEEKLSEAGESRSVKSLTEFHFTLQNTGAMRLGSAGKPLGGWGFAVKPDDDPEIAFVEQPRRARNSALEFNYSASDDYGVVSARAEFRQREATGGKARPLIPAPDFALPLPRRNTREAKLKTSRDLTSHPWAGAMVDITLVANDAAGQTGHSETISMRLPERVFRKPLAAALVEERRNLAMDANQAAKVAEMIDIISETAPEEFIKSAGVYAGLRVAYHGIRDARDDDELRAVLDLLWDIALGVEDGDLSLAERRLRDAQERLSEALENGASDEEIERLMKELRQAMADFMREMAEQMAKNPPSQQMPIDPDAQMLTQRDLERMMDRIEDLAKSGSRDAARQLLSEMQRMMDNLQAGRHQQQRQAEGDQFNQQMNQLGEMMRQQQKLMDETFGMQQRQQGQQGQQGQGRQGQQGQRQQGQQGQRQQGQQGQNGQMTPEELADALKRLQQEQGALRDQLKQMMEDLKNQGLDPGREMGEAGEAMGNARDALGEGESGQAVDEQGRALNALRRGAQQMMQQMQRQMAGERGGTDANGQQRNRDNDPLGRRQRTRGPDQGEATRVPDEIDAQRAREILEAIRRKLSNPARPRLELDYLDRLLRQR